MATGSRQLFSVFQAADAGNAAQTTIPIDLPRDAGYLCGATCQINTAAQGPIDVTIQLGYREATGFVNLASGTVRAGTNANDRMLDTVTWTGRLPLFFRPIIQALIRNDSGSTVTNVLLTALVESVTFGKP